MNGSLRRLRLVASVVSMTVTVMYVFGGRPDALTLVALIGWNLTCLGLYQWTRQ